MIGRVLGNRYEIIEKVGSGGMANVYKAKDRMLNRFVAVKVLHSEFKEDEEFIRRFNIESQAAASLSHQNIVQIYDVGDEDGIQYIVMEFLNGMTLKEYIKSKPGGLYWKEAVDYSMQICRALEHAHQKHIIHRDIKPQNILITPDGILKVTDFGIARAANNNTTKMSSTAIGSAHYLSPEQARGGYTDQRSDIYSLGVVMYELFTGRLPFDGETPVAVAMKHIQEVPVPPRKLNSAIPKGIEQIILKAMNKEVRLRYNSADEVISDLKTLYLNPDALIDAPNTENGETRVIDAKQLKQQIEEADELSQRKRTAEKPSTQRKRKKKSGNGPIVAAIIVALILVVALTLLAIFMLNGGGEDELPSIINLSVEQAEAKLKASDRDYVLEIISYETNSAPKGTIISQQLSTDGKTVEVVVSDGPGDITVEDYTNERFATVESQLSSYGLIVEKKEESSDELPEGYIIRQEPESGVLSEGDTITLYVSTGSEYVKVPDLTGKSEAEARADIERNGLTVGKVFYRENEKVKGIVYDQSREPGTKELRGSAIDIFVSDGPGQSESNNNSTQTTSNSSPSSETEYDTTGSEPQRPDIVDDPSQIEEKKTIYLYLTLPDDKDKVTVKLVNNGKTIYEKEHSTDPRDVRITLKGNGTIKVDIYYDGVYSSTKEVKFD